MPCLIPNLKVPAELHRFSLAVLCGITSACLIANSGMAAGGAYIFSLVVGTIGFIAFGGRYRAFHTGIFGTVLVLTLYLLALNSGITSDLEEVLLQICITVYLPMTLALIVNLLF